MDYPSSLAGTVLSLDVMDISGETQRDISHNIVKTRLNSDGTQVPNSANMQLRNELDKLNAQRQEGYCGSCYGGTPPEGGCCNTCDQVREAYVQRGWSFGNPDAIEQVRLPLLPAMLIRHMILLYLSSNQLAVCSRALVRKVA